MSEQLAMIDESVQVAVLAGRYLPQSLAVKGWTETVDGDTYLINHPDGRNVMTIKNDRPWGWSCMNDKECSAATQVVTDANRETFGRAFQRDNRDDAGMILNDLGAFSRILLKAADRVVLVNKTPFEAGVSSDTEGFLAVGPKRKQRKLIWAVGPTVKQPYILIRDDPAGTLQGLVDELLAQAPWLIQAGGMR